jgi:ketosteroid isomerase-like protein
MSTTSELKVHLDRAVALFDQAWKQGDWQPFIDQFADEFVFEFPAGEKAGRWHGAEAVAKRDAWRQTHEPSDRIVDTGEDLRLYDGHWIVVCDHGKGTLGGRNYQGTETVMMKVDDEGRIVEYREFLGGLGR